MDKPAWKKSSKDNVWYLYMPEEHFPRPPPPKRRKAK